MAKVNLPSNSDKSKSELEKRYEERQDLKRRPVSKTDVAKKKEQGMVESFFNWLVPNDVDTVVDNVVEYRVKPAFKRIVFDTITETARQLLDEGGSGRGNRNSLTDYRRESGGSTVNSSVRRSDNRDSDYDSRSYKRFDSRRYPFPNRGKAEEVLYILRKDIHDYGAASVAAFLKEAGYEPDWNEYDIGWTDLSEGSCYVRSSLDGFFVVLPAPVRIHGI